MKPLSFLILTGCIMLAFLHRMAAEPDFGLSTGVWVSPQTSSFLWATRPKSFDFIVTGSTTIQEVVNRVGHWDRVRGSGTQHYEYDLPDGSVVLVSPAWPFRLDSKVLCVAVYKSSADITLYP